MNIIMNHHYIFIITMLLLKALGFHLKIFTNCTKNIEVSIDIPYQKQKGTDENKRPVLV